MTVPTVLADALMPALRLLPAELAHEGALMALRHGWTPVDDTPDEPILGTRVWDRSFPNPIGLAAGFDKDAVALDGLLGLGFGFLEVGSVTPRPQPGNPKPRLFRLTADHAVINRMGFNNEGVAAAAARIASWRQAARARPGRLGVNLGKNKDSEDAAADYSLGAARVARLADYVVINVSSPNTPGLRDLQIRDRLLEVLGRTRHALAGAAASPLGTGADRDGGVPPLVLKIAPDLSERAELDLAEVAMGELVDGLIVSNTTIARPDGLRSRHRDQAGGLSGRPLFAPSTALLRRMRVLTHGQVPLIGVGGVESGRDAYEKIRAGASLVQLYSALVFAGPGLIGQMKRDLAALLRADGFASVSEAVGVDAR